MTVEFWRQPGAWIEVVENGGVGPDFGWPSEGLRFAYLGSKPPADLSWEELIYEWVDAGAAPGEGETGRWARTYLTADTLRKFLRVAFGADGLLALSLEQRIHARHRYIASAYSDLV